VNFIARRMFVIAVATTAVAAPSVGHAEFVSPTPRGTARWSSLGPMSARSSFNGSYYDADDTGRVNSVRVDPTNPEVVYLASAGGGVWKTTNATNSRPTWTPLGVSVLAVGAMDIDVTNPQKVMVGLGDVADQAPFGAVQRSLDGGATWNPPVTLSGTRPGGGSLSAQRFRDLRIDPSDPTIVLAATDVGLFRSVDGGQSFALVDLPNLAAYGSTLESVWSIAYTGTAGKSHWVASGVYACPGQNPPPAGATTPSTCANGPPQGNLVDIWTSGDAGATWTSVQAQATTGLPPPTQAGAQFARIVLAAGVTSDPATTVLYAAATSVSAVSVPRTDALLKSSDGGSTWVAVGRSNMSPTNPTLGSSSSGCTNLDVGSSDSGLALAVAVDPGDSDRVIIGGARCSVRSIDGGATWQNATHFVPSSGLGDTANGRLPRVALDWETALIVRQNGRAVTYAGTYSGIFVSRDTFDTSTPEQATWTYPDLGLVIHQAYSVASGDPTLGTGNVLFTGLQSAGLRYRLSDGAISSTDLGIFDQLFGGSSTGTIIASDPSGQNVTYWAAVAGSRPRFCRPDRYDCSKATRIEADNKEYQNWPLQAPFTLPTGDSFQFQTPLSPLWDAAGSALTATARTVWAIAVDAQDRQTVRRLNTSDSGITAVGLPRTVRGVYAAPSSYTVDGKEVRVYGIGLSGGTAAIIVDDGSKAPPISPSSSVLSAFGDQIPNVSSVALPRDPASLGGSDIRKTYLVASSGTVTVANAPISQSVGHLFLTVDGGGTWVPLHGSGASALPNVPIYVVRFDPNDPTDSVLYAGTEVGLYRSTDHGATWSEYGVGLPPARVTDLTIARNGSLIRVATYGRGIWEIHPHNEMVAQSGDGDWDQNGIIDFRDVAALATRLGSTPGGVQNPEYDWTVDLGGTPDSLDDDDLTALVAKLGGTP
jgi:hypothetical protein